MRMKKISFLFLAISTPLYLAACSTPASGPAQNTTPVVYKNDTLGISMTFPSGWQLMTHQQYTPQFVDITEPQMKSLFEAICSKALFCAVKTSAQGISFAAMGASQEPAKLWKVFNANIETAVAYMKKYGKNDLQVEEMKQVNIDKQPFIHVTHTQNIDNKLYTFDTYYTQYPNFTLNYIAISYLPNLTEANSSIMQTFHKVSN